MTDLRFLRLKEILSRALELPEAERQAFVESACAGDPDLKAEIERILSRDPGGEVVLRSRGLHELVGSVFATETDGVEDGRLEHAHPGTIGPYRILNPLGEGGMGTVFLAEQEQPIRRRVALKLIKLGMDTKAVLARFESERQALAVMDHPNIAKIFDAGATPQGRPYFVMELVVGDSITEYCDRHALATRDRLQLFVPVCRAVQHAHQKGVIHRDLKPSNILISLTDDQPVPKVIDFGIAKATSTPLTQKTFMTQGGQLVGTPEYMSPEQAGIGAPDVDTRTDVYSLGILLYELLTGSRPFDRKHLRSAGYAEIERVIQEEEPAKPSTRVSTSREIGPDVARKHSTDIRSLTRQLRGDLDWIVLRAMEKDRTRRYDTVNGLVLDIERYLRDEPVLAGQPSAAYRFRKFAKRHKVGIAVASAVLFGLTAAALGLTYALIESNRQRAIAQAARDEAEAVRDFLSGMLAAADPRNRGRDTPVGEVLDAASQSIDGSFGGRPQVQAELHATVGNAYRALGDYASSRRHLEGAVDTQQRELGLEHPKTLSSMNSLAILDEVQGRYAEAESLHAQVLETQRRVLGPEHPETLESMTNLAAVLLDQGRREEAALLLHQALGVQRLTVGEEDRETLGSMNNLANLYREIGKYSEAESLHVRVLEIQRRLLGDEHPETLGSMNGLAALYLSQRRYQDAEPLLEETVKIRRRRLGDEHPETLNAMNNLATMYADLGRYDESTALHREILDTRRRVLGNEHPHTLISMGNLGDTYTQMGNPARGESLLAAASRTAKRVFGPRHLIHSVSLRKHGVCLRELGRYKEAEAALLEANQLLDQELGSDHDRTLQAKRDLADLYRAWGKPEQAAAVQPAANGRTKE